MTTQIDHNCDLLFVEHIGKGHHVLKRARNVPPKRRGSLEETTSVILQTEAELTVIISLSS